MRAGVGLALSSSEKKSQNNPMQSTKSTTGRGTDYPLYHRGRKMNSHGLGIGPTGISIRVGPLRRAKPRLSVQQDVVTAEMLSAIYRTEVIVEDTPSGRRVCVPAWGSRPPSP